MIVLTPFESGGDMNPNPDINDVLRKFNRETASLVVWLLGGLIIAALAFAVLIPERYRSMAALKRPAIQAESVPSLPVDAAEFVKIVDSQRDLQTKCLWER